MQLYKTENIGETVIFHSREKAFQFMKDNGYIYHSETSNGWHSDYWFYKKGLAHKMHATVEKAIHKAYGMDLCYMPCITEFSECDEE